MSAADATFARGLRQGFVPSANATTALRSPRNGPWPWWSRYGQIVLRRIDLKDSWRSLDKGFWSGELPAGGRTVVYGHNGSGKSTLSELLLSLADGACATNVVWEDEDKRRTAVGPGSPGPATAMAVFTRKWVEAILSAFLDGASVSAIVTLGKEAIDAKDEEVRLVKEIQKLRDDATEASKQYKATTAKIDKLAREVQENIVSELKVFDYNPYTKNRYSVPKVQEDLRAYKGEFPDTTAHAEALKRLGQGAPSIVRQVVAPPAGVASSLTGLSELMAETPTRIAIQVLEGDRAAQTWVEQGLQLHEGLDHCQFCSAEISKDRRDRLAHHFDESWLEIRSRAKTLRDSVSNEKHRLAGWYEYLPTVESLASELQPVYEGALSRAKADVEERITALSLVESALDAKSADPSAVPETPNWTVLRVPQATTVLARAVTEHNGQAHRHEEVTFERKQTVLDHLVGSQAEAFRTLEREVKTGRSDEDRGRLCESG